jgi:hypothetical protein
MTERESTGRWRAGYSGNPAGRPKGSRNKLGEEFIAALYADFMANGEAAIERVRLEKPDQYLRVIAAIVPKELAISANPLDDATDSELAEMCSTSVEPYPVIRNPGASIDRSNFGSRSA